MNESILNNKQHNNSMFMLDINESFIFKESPEKKDQENYLCKEKD